MEKYGKFQAIDLTSTSTQSSQNNDVLEIASSSHPEISPILTATSSEFQNIPENLNTKGLKANFKEAKAKPTAAVKKFQLEDDSDVIIIEDEQADPPPTVVIPEIHQKTTKSVPLAEKILRILKVAKSPLIISEIQEKVGAAYDKKLLEKLLQELVSQGKVLVKTYSKLPIYCFNNKIKAEANQNDVKSLDEKIHKYQQKINKKQARISVVEAQLNKDSNASELSLDSLQSQHNNLTDTVNKLQSQADEIKRSDGPKMDPKDYANLQHEREKFLDEYTKRKRMCMNLIDAVLEGYPKSKQKLIEDTEIETDEAAGFDINQYK